MNFFKLLQYDVGDGNRVKFWKHVWYGDCTLKATFLELYCLSRTKDSSVAEVMRWASGRIYWNFHFRHPLQDWEEESYDRFMDTIYSSKVRGVGFDKVFWKPARSGDSEIGDFYLFFYPHTLFSSEVGVAIKGSPKGGFLFMFSFFFFLISNKILLKRKKIHPGTQGVYKGEPNKN